jgi:uncharacterized lipoprotein YmbA
MMPTRWQAPTVLLVLALGGCGSSPPVSYYDLEALESDYVAVGEAYMTVGVGPLRTPDYLSRSQIVTRRSDATVVVDDFHRWVEPVDDAIYRIVSENLDSLIDDVVVVAFPYTHISDLDYQLIGRVSRFDADQDGTAVLQIPGSAQTRPLRSKGGKGRGLPGAGTSNERSAATIQPRRGQITARRHAPGRRLGDRRRTPV